MRIEGHSDLLLGQATGLSIGLVKGGSVGASHEQSQQSDKERTIHVVSIRLSDLNYANCLRQRFIYGKRKPRGGKPYLISAAELQVSVRCDAVSRYDLVLSAHPITFGSQFMALFVCQAPACWFFRLAEAPLGCSPDWTACIFMTSTRASGAVNYFQR